MKSGGIDITMYTSHSTRSALTSSCEAKGFSTTEIMKAAGWSNSGTFEKFYGKPVDHAVNFGTVVLQYSSDLQHMFLQRRLQMRLIAFAVCFVLFCLLFNKVKDRGFFTFVSLFLYFWIRGTGL